MAKRWPLPVVASSKRASRALPAGARAWGRRRQSQGARSAAVGQEAPSLRHAAPLPSARFAADVAGRPGRDLAGPAWVVFSGWNGRAVARAANLSGLGTALPRAAHADGLACGWPCPWGTGRFSAEVACQHGSWLVPPAFAAGFQRCWRGQARGDAKRRLGSTEATEFLRCTGACAKNGVPHQRGYRRSGGAVVRVTERYGLLTAMRSICCAAGQAWHRSAVCGKGTTDS
jgi:hypothetical protein